MRKFLLALAVIVPGFGASAIPAAAAPYYPWCARYSSSGGECAFNTIQQCLEGVSGIGGFCQPNPAPAPAYNYAPRRNRTVR